MSAEAASGAVRERHVNAERHVVIVGGGVSGLAAAYDLIDRAEGPPPRVTVLEASPAFGGLVGTDAQDGWVLERGPDLFLGGKPGGWELCERLGIATRLHGTSPAARGSYVVRAGRLKRIPEGLTGLIPTKFGPFARSALISPLGKLRLGLDLFIPSRTDDGDESVESFVVRRLGREMYDRLVEPLLSGIYAGDGGQLSVLATFPHLRDGERKHGSMVKAMLAARRPPAGAPPRGFVTLPGGLGELVETLVARLRERGATLGAGAAVSALAREEGGGWRVATARGDDLHADAVVVATSARAAAKLLADVAPGAVEPLRAIPHVSSATVSLGFRMDDVPRPLDGTGYVIPRAEGRTALACTWTSSKFDGRAPAGHALFRVFLGGASRPPVVHLDDAGLVAMSRDELRAMVGVRAEPVLVHVVRHVEALPQYTLGHRERVARILAAVDAVPGLAIAGNAYHGIGIPDCIRSGQLAAARATGVARRAS